MLQIFTCIYGSLSQTGPVINCICISSRTGGKLEESTENTLLHCCSLDSVSYIIYKAFRGTVMSTQMCLHCICVSSLSCQHLFIAMCIMYDSVYNSPTRAFYYTLACFSKSLKKVINFFHPWVYSGYRQKCYFMVPSKLPETKNTYLIAGNGHITQFR